MVGLYLSGFVQIGSVPAGKSPVLDRLMKELPDNPNEIDGLTSRV